MSNVDILAVEFIGMNWWKIHGTLKHVQLQQAGFKWDSYDTKIMDVQSLDALEQSGRREKTWENIRVIIGFYISKPQTKLERDFDHGVLQIIQSTNLLSVDVGWEFNGLDFASIGWPEHLHQGWIMQKKHWSKCCWFQTSCHTMKLVGSTLLLAYSSFTPIQVST